jgi:hypothetical protein
MKLLVLNQKLKGQSETLQNKTNDNLKSDSYFDGMKSNKITESDCYPSGKTTVGF